MPVGIKFRDTERKAILLRAIEMLSKEPIGKEEISRRLRVSQATIYRCQLKYPKLAKELRKLYLARDIHRTEQVEEVFVNRLLNDKGQPSEYIFYLTNRSGERWKDKRNSMSQTLVNQIENKPIVVEILQDGERKILEDKASPETGRGISGYIEV